MLEMLLERLSQKCGKMKRYWLLRLNETSAKEDWYFISTYFGRQYISDIASALLTIAIGHF